MKDFPAQLLELANELQKTAPKGPEDAKVWMNRAGDLADACIVDGRLSQKLFTVIPLKEHGDFVRHVKVIKAASGSYNAGLRPNIDNALPFIIKVLSREDRTESKSRFSVASIPELTKRLTFVQKQLFDDVWNHVVTSGTPFPIRGLPRIIGKQSIQHAFEGLNGSLIYETSEQGDRCLKLTFHGALLTGHGTYLAALLVRVLDLVNELYENNNFIKIIERNQIKDRLGISDAETALLLNLLKLGLPPNMPFFPSGWTTDGSSWTVSITDEVINLFRTDDTIAYLDDRLSAGYSPGEPYSYDERLRLSLESGAKLNPPLTTLPG